MRGAPHKGFSALIRRISARSSASIFGRPPRERDFHRQYRRKPARCHRTRVSGRMIVMVLRTDGNQRYSMTKNKRSPPLRSRRFGHAINTHEVFGTHTVEINYSQPLAFLPAWLPLKYKALVVMHGPKGCGEPCQPLGPGFLRTTEYLTQQYLVFDVGQAFWNLPQRYVIFGGYRWWKNKFGISPDQPNGFVVGTTESTWLMGTAMKF